MNNHSEYLASSWIISPNTTKINMTYLGILAIIALSGIVLLPITFAVDETTVMMNYNTDLPGCEKDNSCMTPSVLTVSVGTIVNFVNEDAVMHTITSGSPYDGPSGDFDSGLIGIVTSDNNTFSKKFYDVGSYNYFCMIHPWATGMIVVEDVDENTNSEFSSIEQMATTETESQSSEGGGCLIATAAYGSEMAPQVQFLREIRDNTVLQTQSGTSFMTAFNTFYYTFSPTIADYERENPVFKEAVKVGLTPLLTSLTILNYADIDTEQEMLGYGIGIIMLNIGMYLVAPAVVVIALSKKLRK